MLSLRTNAVSLVAQNAITATQKSLSIAQTRLSTGLRINSSQDDAAGLQIATRLKAQTSGIAVAMRNTQNSISIMQTADGALNETTSILSRMKDLATQAADGSSSAADQTAIQAEYDSLTSELSNIIANTSFGGTKLLNTGTGKFTTAEADGNGGVTFQIGASASETATISLGTQMTALDTALTAAATQYNGTTGAASTPSRPCARRSARSRTAWTTPTTTWPTSAPTPPSPPAAWKTPTTPPRAPMRSPASYNYRPARPCSSRATACRRWWFPCCRPDTGRPPRGPGEPIPAGRHTRRACQPSVK